MKIQLHSESSGPSIGTNSLKKAFEEAETNRDIWKISFSLDNGERVRLIRQVDVYDSIPDQWVYESMGYWDEDEESKS